MVYSTLSQLYEFLMLMSTGNLIVGCRRREKITRPMMLLNLSQEDGEKVRGQREHKQVPVMFLHFSVLFNGKG